MTLRTRLALLERKTPGTEQGPSVIVLETVSRTDDGDLIATPHHALVKGPHGFQTVNRLPFESSEAFVARCDDLSGFPK